MDALVQLVFRGEVHPGHLPDEVRRRLGQALKLDEARLAQMFSGARMVLKRSLHAADAARYVEQLTRLGALVHVEPMPAPLAPTGSPAAPAPAPTASVLPPIEEEIVCPTCGERQSKRLLCRACATNMPMGIAAKLEAEEQARAARLAGSRDTRAGRRGREREVVEVLEPDPDAPSAWGFGFSGRVGRLPYATASFWLITIMALAGAHLIQRPSFSRLVLTLLAAAVVFLCSVRLTVLRLHDFDRHAGWGLFFFVPGAGTLLSLALSFLPGTRGDNDFGGPPRRGRKRWLLLSLLVLALSLMLLARNAMHMAERAAAESADDETHVERDEIDGLPPAAAAAFRSEYSLSGRHKAFAASQSGTWGVSSGLSTPRDAARAALAQCEERRPAYTAPCRLLNVDDHWVAPTE